MEVLVTSNYHSLEVGCCAPDAYPCGGNAPPPTSILTNFIGKVAMEGFFVFLSRVVSSCCNRAHGVSPLIYLQRQLYVPT